MTVLGILVLIGIRQLSRPDKPGRKSRFAGSNFGQAYFVEAVILIVGVCIFMLHALEGAQHHVSGYEASFFISYPVVSWLRGMDVSTLQNLTYFFAGLKIATDAIVHVSSGVTDATGTLILSYLHKAIKPVNVLRAVEDATVYELRKLLTLSFRPSFFRAIVATGEVAAIAWLLATAVRVSS